MEELIFHGVNRMRKIVVASVLIAFCVVASGCSDHMYGLRETQKTDLRDWAAAGQDVVEEKSPQAATVLGFFIGLGAFYTDQPVLGVIDLLFWPASILWEPWLAPGAANKINYQATKDAWERRNRK